ncbi:pantoate-beta-alanine ligase domain-containing protein [Ditylenchus destructor]|nr:pantoate-beta-alanine ligase domain-containing protein [Ditylenchus destructor]
MVKLFKSIVGIRNEINGWNGQYQVAFVPTMGALHEGHLSLIDFAAQYGRVVVSIFVNPLQFGPQEDFDRYPRQLENDIELIGDRAHVVFAPQSDEMYPSDQENSITVSAGKAGLLYEGKHRNGHFNGVLTVLTKLFNIIQPNVVVLGQKDAEQVFVVREMAHQLNFPIKIYAAPTLREPNGLAMSSRNRYLSEEERSVAGRIYRALTETKNKASKGYATSNIRKAAMNILEESSPLFKLDYLAIVEEKTFKTIDDSTEFKGLALVLLAAFVGSTRLIDNIEIEIL